jgi:undecaprenyl diphosphate synthase
VVVQPAPAPPLLRLRALPRHVAIIMDGNGRWAAARNLKRTDGHRAGAEAILPVVERLGDYHVKVLTLFGFSTENWGRPRHEVEAILRLGGEFIDRYLGDLDTSGVQLRHLGDVERLPGALRSRMEKAIERTKQNDRMIVNVAFNYGGRADIVQAVRRLVADGVPAAEITEEAIAARLATGDLPEPDLLIRTGGEHRISNFLVWQAAYSEYYFTETLWPDFGPAEVDRALAAFSERQRRFGLVDDDGPPDDVPPPAAAPGPDATPDNQRP